MLFFRVRVLFIGRRRAGQDRLCITPARPLLYSRTRIPGDVKRKAARIPRRVFRRPATRLLSLALDRRRQSRVRPDERSNDSYFRGLSLYLGSRRGRIYAPGASDVDVAAS